MNESTDTITLAAQAGGLALNLELNTLADMQTFCKVVAGTELVPKLYVNKPDAVLVAAMQGREIGLKFFQSLQSIAVVNGVPSIFGDAALALIRGSGQLDDFDEWIEVEGVRQEGPFPILKYAEEGKLIVAFCRSKRKGMSRDRVTFYSVDDAKRAGLWEKKSASGFPSPWCTVPQRMLMFRARSWNLRDNFGDVLKGRAFYEESIDLEPTPDGGFAAPATEAAPAPAPKAGGLSTLLSSKLAETQRKTIVVNPGPAPAPPAAPAETAKDAPGTTISTTLDPAPASSQSEGTTGQDEAKPTGSEAKAVGGEISLADEALAHALAHDLLATLEATAKGRALLAGVRKAVKLTNPAQRTPDDTVRFKLFLEELVVAKSKL